MGDVGRAVQAAARFNSFHPVRDYFASLKWDGVPRLETWLQDFCRVKDSLYVRAIGPRYLIAAVGRTYRPGCKVDHVLVLEGPQGFGKSEALRTLAVRDEWFTDRISPPSSKDAAIEIAGVLIIEFAEMDALLRDSASAGKSFIARRIDNIRLPYGKYITSLKRGCVLGATINPPPDGGYLRDPTGARRFWPAFCHGMIDIDGLRAVRDQLWAEACVLFKAGAYWWLETPALEALATAEQAARFAADVWEEPLREWAGDRDDISIWDAYGALGFKRGSPKVDAAP